MVQPKTVHRRPVICGHGNKLLPTDPDRQTPVATFSRIRGTLLDPADCHSIKVEAGQNAGDGAF
jgi:hypothetical protein